MINVTDLHRSFGRGKRKATPVDGVSHTFRDGAVTSILGLNGTGKSTLLRLMCGLLRPSSGEVSVYDSATLDSADPGGTVDPSQAIGAFLDVDAVHPGHTGRRHLHWVAAARGCQKQEANRLLISVGLATVADSPVGGYSLGMKQRLGIATALLGAPQNIVLDEPLNGLDVAGMIWLRSLMRTLADRGHCVIVASHHMADVEATSDDIVILESGRLVAAGATSDVRGDHDNLEEAFVSIVPRANSHKVSR